MRSSVETMTRVIAPADVPHKFINSGTGQARHIDIHTNRRMITEWLE